MQRLLNCVASIQKEGPACLATALKSTPAATVLQPDEKQQGKNALHLSVHFETYLKLLTDHLKRHSLLSQGLASRDQLGRMPLHVAVQQGYVGSSRFLINLGSDVNARAEHDTGPTPLMLLAATKQPNPDVAKALIEKGAAVAAVDENGNNALGILIDGRLKGRRDPSSNGIRTACVLIAKSNPAPVLTPEQQSALLFEAANHGTAFDVDGVLKVVDERGWSIQNDEGDTPFHILCRKMTPDVLFRCVEKGANSRIKNKCGKFAAQLVLTERGDNSSPAKLPLQQYVTTIRNFVKWGVHVDGSWFAHELEHHAILAGQRDLCAAVNALLTNVGIISVLANVVVSYAIPTPKRRRVAVSMEPVLRKMGVLPGASNPKRARKSGFRRISADSQARSRTAFDVIPVAVGAVPNHSVASSSSESSGAMAIDSLESFVPAPNLSDADADADADGEISPSQAVVPAPSVSVHTL